MELDVRDHPDAFPSIQGAAGHVIAASPRETAEQNETYLLAMLGLSFDNAAVTRV